MEHTIDARGVFPDAATVKIYADGSVPDTTAAPSGAALQEKEVKEGAATFTELTEGAVYWVYAKVGEEHRYLRLTPGAPGLNEEAFTNRNETVSGDWTFSGALTASGTVGFHGEAASAQGAALTAAGGAVGETYDAETKAALEAAITRIGELEARLVAKGLIAE